MFLKTAIIFEMLKLSALLPVSNNDKLNLLLLIQTWTGLMFCSCVLMMSRIHLYISIARALACENYPEPRNVTEYKKK